MVDGSLIDAGRLTGALLAFVPDVVDRDGLDIAALLVPLHHPPDVRVHASAAADEADVDAVVRANHATLRHGRSLTRRVEPVSRGHRPGHGHGAGAHPLDEVASRRLVPLRHVHLLLGPHSLRR